MNTHAHRRRRRKVEQGIKQNKTKQDKNNSNGLKLMAKYEKETNKNQ